jgi:hypothetical protein
MRRKRVRSKIWEMIAFKKWMERDNSKSETG